MTQPAERRMVTEANLPVLLGSKARYGGGPQVGSMVDVDRFVAPNAASNLSITTYVGGNNEVVEPSVWFDPNGLFGYEFWMAAGPYEGQNAAFENPSIWVSHDGLTWVVPPGGSNPVTPAPASGNYDDPHLFELNGTLHLVWNWTRSGGLGDQILYIYTTDGITWTAPVAILTSLDGSAHEYISPHVEYQDGTWHLWYLSLLGGTRTIYHRTASTLTGTWSSAVACTTPLPANRDHWEFEIRRVGSEWWMLQCCVTSGGTAAGGQLHLRTSGDGVTWNISRLPVLTGDYVGPTTKWDSGFIYKSSFLPLEDGRIAIWYSAGGGSPTMLWRIGFTIAGEQRRDSLFTGTWYAPPCVSVGTGTMSNGMAYYFPVYFDHAVSIQALGVEVTSAATAGAVLTIGVYGDNGYGRPGKLIFSGTVDPTTTGVKTITGSWTLGPGLLFLSGVVTGSPATVPTIRFATGPSLSAVLVGVNSSTTASGNNLSGYRQGGQTGLADPAGVDISLTTSNVPRLFYQAT